MLRCSKADFEEVGFSSIFPAIVCLAAYRIGLCHSRSGESRELAMVG